MKSKPFLIKPDKTGHALASIPPDKRRFTESWLQELLQNHPQILPVDEIEPIFSPLVPIGREIPTNSGPIDNLFISKAGYPVLVETKLWRNPEARRTVLAQAIDYAGALSHWSFDQLDKVTHEKTKKGLLDLIRDENPDLDEDDMPTEESIARNLRLGRFLVLVVGDQIQSSMIELLKYANRFPHLATNVGLVELQCYSMPDNPDEILVVPSIVARTEIVERSIVQVTLSPSVEHEITVEQIKTPEGDRSRPAPLSEQEFWDRLKEQAPQCVEPVRLILEHYSQDRQPNVVLKKRRSAIAARMYLPDNDQRLSLFLIYTTGQVEFWPATLIQQLESAGLDRSLGEEYQKKLKMLLKKSTKTLVIYHSADQINLEAFFQTVDELIEAVQAAEPKSEE